MSLKKQLLELTHLPARSRERERESAHAREAVASELAPGCAEPNMAEIAANMTAPKCEYMSYPSFLVSPTCRKMSAKMRFSMTAAPNRAPLYASAHVSTRQLTTDCYLQEGERKDEVEHAGDSEVS